MKNVLIFGATSAIAEATARRYALEKCSLFLVGRNAARLDEIRADLLARGASEVTVHIHDATDIERQAQCLEVAVSQLGRIDIALIAHGSLSDQNSCELSVDETMKELNVNAMSMIAIMTDLANIMVGQKQGTIAVISSVAGDRGRKSNYVYGSAKAMVTAFAQGLRNRVYTDGVHVVTVIPGFVDTPMTADFDKNFLWASADDIAQGIVGAIQKQRNVVYLPFFWRYIMLVIRHIPEFVFKRLSL